MRLKMQYISLVNAALVAEQSALSFQRTRPRKRLTQPPGDRASHMHMQVSLLLSSVYLEGITISNSQPSNHAIPS
jgi:hypothetical protein